MYTFRLFKVSQQKRFNSILLCLLLFLFFGTTILMIKDTYPFLKILLFAFCTIIGCYVIFILGTNKKRYDFIPGTFIGTISFNENGITLLDLFISYHEIQHITFKNHDFLGRYNKKALFQPSVSIGVSNEINILTTNGSVYEYQFQQQHDYELFKAFKYLNTSKTTYNWHNNTLNN